MVVNINGESKLIFTQEHLVDIIRDYMGNDVADIVESNSLTNLHRLKQALKGAVEDSNRHEIEADECYQNLLTAKESINRLIDYIHDAKRIDKSYIAQELTRIELEDIDI